MNDLAVDEFAKVAIKRLVGEETGDQKKERHAERLGEFRQRAENEGQLSERGADAGGRVLHHHYADRQAHGHIDPVDALFRDVKCGIGGQFRSSPAHAGRKSSLFGIEPAV